MALQRRERLAAGFAWLVVRLRFLLLPGWIAAALAATLALPGLGSGEPLALGGLVPRDSEAIEAGERAARAVLAGEAGPRVDPAGVPPIS
jgi:hypothetical protein